MIFARGRSFDPMTLMMKMMKIRRLDDQERLPFYFAPSLGSFRSCLALETAQYL